MHSFESLIKDIENLGILKMTRRANVNYYRVADEHISTIIKMSVMHLSCEE